APRGGRRKGSAACVAGSSGSPPEGPGRPRGWDPARRGRDLLRTGANSWSWDGGPGGGGGGTGDGRGRGYRRRLLSSGRRAPGAERDRIRSRDGKTLGRRL